MIDWNDNAKAAVERFADWAKLSDNGLLGEFDKYMSTTQTKTVADVVEQKGEKWTHCYCGERCKIIGEPDSFGRVVILTESDAYFLDKPETLKPIKPTLTKTEAWDKLNESKCSVHEFGDRLIKLQKDYDII